MDVETWVRALAEAGLIQFGRFQQPDGSVWPVSMRLNWLPSYPALLRDSAAMIAAIVTTIGADRLLTTVEALPLGVAVSLRADLPLVYPYGKMRDHTAAFAFEGAYDVGHPTVLLVDVLADSARVEALAEAARRVGLEVLAVAAALDLERGARLELEQAGFAVTSAVKFGEALPVLTQAGLLSHRMWATVEQWRQGDAG